jgi:hypothetical protein
MAKFVRLCDRRADKPIGCSELSLENFLSNTASTQPDRFGFANADFLMTLGQRLGTNTMNLRLSIALVATVAILQGCSSDIDRLNSPGTGGVLNDAGSSADGSAGGTGPNDGTAATGGSDAATGGGVTRLYDDNYVSTTSSTGSFTLFASSAAAPIVVNAADFAGVVLAATNLQTDIQSVTGTIPTLVNDTIPATASQVIIIGTVGQSDLITSLVSAGKLDVSSITGKWEASLIQVVEAPVAGVDRALVIAGSDKRGTIYGIYDLSKKIGVSPWYWWADVPAQTKTAVYVSAGTHALNSPGVKYRGIFLNDEDPELNGLVAAKFGRYNTLACYVGQGVRR